MICTDRLLFEVTNRELRSCAHLVYKDWQQIIDTSAVHDGLSLVPVYPDTNVRCNFCLCCLYLLYRRAPFMCLLTLTPTQAVTLLQGILHVHAVTTPALRQISEPADMHYQGSFHPYFLRITLSPQTRATVSPSNSCQLAWHQL